MSSHQTRGRPLRAARYAAYAVAVLAVVLVGAALVLPLFLDTPAVERELQAKLSQLAQGEVAWEKLSIRLLPSPRGSLFKVRAEIPGVAGLRAEEVDAHLRLLPLLRGRAEIASVSLSKPAIRIAISPSPPAKEAPADPVGAYRSIVEGIRRFAPQAELNVEEGELELVPSGMPPVRVRALELRGRTESRGMTTELSAASDDWSRLKAAASVDFADFSGTAKLEVSGLKPQPWLDRFLGRSPVGVSVTDANLRIDARSDGRTRLEADFDLRTEGVDVLRATKRVRFPDVAVGGRVTANGEGIALRLAGARLGASRLGGGSLRYRLKRGSLAGSAEFDLDLAQAMDATRRLLPEETAKSLAPIQRVSGRAQGQARFEMRRSAWNTFVDIRKSDSSVGIEGLPGPVRVATAKVSVTGDTVSIESANVAMLDARALASATIGYGKQLRIEGTVSEGGVGENLLAWVWKKAGAPPHLVLKAPIAVVVKRAAWSPKQPLDLAATASFDAGPSIAVDLGWTPEVLDIHRAAIKDTKSDAVIALHLEKRLLQGRFAGSLQSASLGTALKKATVPGGGWSGDLRFRFDLDHPEQFSATGKLTGEAIDLAWLLERAVTIERADLQADGQKLRIRQASVNWAEQRFTLRGELARAADGAPIIDAQIESPGIVVDALLHGAEAKAPAAEEKKAKPKGDEPLWTEWPLPVRGHIAFQSKFVQYGERRAEPVSATLTLEEQRAFLELQQVRLCGISLPLTVEGRREGVVIAVRLVAQKQQLEQTARCLTERGVQIDGEFDLSADLRTRGRVPELLSNLEGTVAAEARDGKVMRFAMLGNILTTQAVAGMFGQSGPKIDERGFPYRSITTQGRFEKGAFIIDESFFRSDIIGIAANGSISLIDDKTKSYDSRLTVLVAPLGKLDRMVRSVPVLGYLLGGILTSVPVAVSGDIRNPLVVPLGPGAVLGEVVGIFQRALKLPGRVLPKPP